MYLSNAFEDQCPASQMSLLGVLASARAVAPPARIDCLAMLGGAVGTQAMKKPGVCWDSAVATKPQLWVEGEQAIA